ncbi:MAG: prepilin-type N-terminal cleavage/methylation domain-containing protein [Candidatus Omnitrophota bacterium]
MKAFIRTDIEKGYTLIELLVVTAIIGLLSIIAIQQFLNAKIRADVCRVIADFKAVASALEMYHCDHNIYPINPPRLITNSARYIKDINELTTPISYIQNLPLSPWDGKRSLANYIREQKQNIRMQEDIVIPPDYIYLNIDIYNIPNDGFCLSSKGPSGLTYFGHNYHPSNGLLSQGQIAACSSRTSKI